MTDLWTNLDRIIAAAPDAGALRIHGLGPIAAWRMRERGEPVPPDIDQLAYGGAYAAVTAPPLLQKVVDIPQEPVLVLQAPEAARRYPERAVRASGDLDRLVTGLPWAERTLREAGLCDPMPDCMQLRDSRERTLVEYGLGSRDHGPTAPTVGERIESMQDVRFAFTTHSWQNRRRRFGRIALGARSPARPVSRRLRG